MAADEQDRLGGKDDFGKSLRAHPTNILVIADFGGEDFDADLADRAPQRVFDVESLLGVLSPKVRVRVEDLSKADGSLIDTALVFRRIEDFSLPALEVAIPALARLRRGGDGLLEQQAGTELERAIAAALRGHSVAATSDRGARPRLQEQLDLVRGLSRFSAVERAWLGLARILDAARAAPHACAVSMLPLSGRELARELARIDSGSESALASILDDLATDPAVRPDLIVVDEPLSLTPDGVGALRGLARLSMESASIAVTSIDSAAFAADAARGAGASLGAAAIARLLDEPAFAGFRSIRAQPAAAGLAIVTSAMERGLGGDPSSRWRQSGAVAMCEALVVPNGSSCRFGNAGASQPVPLDDAGTAADVVFSADAGQVLAERGLIGFIRGDAGVTSVGPNAPVVFDPRRLVGGPEEAARAASLDVRTRLGLARLVRLASIATRRQRAPGRDAVSLASFSEELVRHLSPEVAMLAGDGATIAMDAAFEGLDERTLRLDLTLARRTDATVLPAAAARPDVRSAFEVRWSCYPLA